jgi:plastocyanin
MRTGSSSWQRLRTVHRTAWLASVACVQVGVVASGLVLSASSARADDLIAIAPGGCAGGGATFCYQPESATGVTGTAVTWVNATRINHTVTICPSCPGTTGGDNFSLNLNPTLGYTQSYTFVTPGTYVYYCRIHGFNAMHGTITVSGKKNTTIQDGDPRITYDSWAGVSDSHASGHAYRTSATPRAKAAFSFTGTEVAWVTRKGPDQGIATVKIDGVKQNDVDLYATSSHQFVQSYSGLASGTHTIVVSVSGRANPASTSASVAVDAFRVGTTTTEESSIAITYDSWVGGTAPYASGGTYRHNGAAGATASLTFVGTGVDWVTQGGSSNGLADVSIDGVDQGTVDLSTRSGWDVFESYTGLNPGVHTIVVTALGERGASSTGTRVVVDAFLVHP